MPYEDAIFFLKMIGFYGLAKVVIQITLAIWGFRLIFGGD